MSKNILKVQNILRSVFSSGPSNNLLGGDGGEERNRGGDGYYIIELKVLLNMHLILWCLLYPKLCTFSPQIFFKYLYILGTILDIGFIPLCFLKVFFYVTYFFKWR